ncbi:MAG: hypothetical protein HC897_20530 [Thermoanaerobaculia bacterium]|nr:hypothetical protein [Thermoanaerobaculia bacterium]
MRGKLVGVCLTAVLLTPVMPARAAETESDWLGWAEAAWDEVLGLLPTPAEPEATSPQCEPPNDPHASPCIEPSG